MLRGEDAERSARARAFVEGADGVGAGVARANDDGHRLPAVPGEDRRCGVVSRHHEHVGRQRLDLRDEGIEAFERGDLRVEVTVFARLVGVLVVHEEEVVALPVLRDRRHLVGEGAAGLDDIHAHDPREAAIHRVRGDRGGTEPEDLGEPRQVREPIEATQQHHVGGRRIGEHRARLVHERVDDLRGMCRGAVEGVHGQRRLAERLRISFG